MLRLLPQAQRRVTCNVIEKQRRLIKFVRSTTELSCYVGEVDVQGREYEYACLILPNAVILYEGRGSFPSPGLMLAKSLSMNDVKRGKKKNDGSLTATYS